MSETQRNALPVPVPEKPIVTERITLRTMEIDDIDAVAAYRSRPAVHRWLSHGALPPSRLDAKFRRRIARMSLPGTTAADVQLVVVRGDQVVGDCGFTLTSAWTKDDAPTRHLVARIHYALDDAVAGRGYGTEVVRALVTHVFAEPRVHRVHAEVFAPNVASRRVLEKLGFRCEGYFVDDGLIDGRFVDACAYALLRREWEAGVALPAPPGLRRHRPRRGGDRHAA